MASCQTSGSPDRFDDDIGASSAGQSRGPDADEVGAFVVQEPPRPRPSAPRDRAAAPASDGDDARAVDRLGQAHEHHADGPSPMTATVSPGRRAALLQAAHHARQRLHQRGILIADVRRNSYMFFWTIRCGDADVFGVGSVIEQQILAEIFLAARGSKKQAPQGAEFAATTRWPMGKFADIAPTATTSPASS